MTKLIIDDAEIEVPDHYTLLQACEAAGAEIPRFCFHERLSIAGNCRMCLVQVVGGPPKPVASCAMSVKDMRPGRDGTPPTIHTKTDFVKKAREGVMEFLLINHPLDCPICDQGGECDLQDQAMAYGVSGSRFAENKRAVEDKHIGPLVKTIMNRCIQCTRCVRFVTEVAGVPDLGAIGRGEDMEITTYLETAMQSELQGNVIDLCPVGALTSKPYAFQARPWELTKTESVDVMDAVGSAIRVDARGRDVMRIMPRLNEAVNEEWISDKTRFIWDGLKTQRLDQPYVRVDGKLRPASWREAFGAIKDRIANTQPERIGAIGGDLATAEELFAFKALMTRLSVKSVDCRQDGWPLDPENGRASYLFNPTIAGIEQADAILIVGANPRWDAAVLNARIRKAWVQNGTKVGLIGERVDLTYPYAYVGAGTQSLSDLGAFGEILANAERPMVIVGAAALGAPDGADVMATAAKIAVDCGAIAGDWNGFGVLHTAASRVGGLDVGCLPEAGGKNTGEILEGARSGGIDTLFLLGADELPYEALEKPFVIYIGTHGDAGAHAADVILPGATYAEKSGTMVNLEGRPQHLSRAAFAPGEAREDWAILRALSAELNRKLPFDSLAALNAAMVAVAPWLAQTDHVVPADPEAVRALAGRAGSLEDRAFVNPIKSFHLTNPIARASAVMAECARTFAEGDKVAEAAE
ncbi:NADH-quinone oxidoreductase subunit NuoG [Acuticoccus sp. MNP-M23]|uniref:NADH-quinone oxidoreductase subunit NuoG n=1 Tax=Acuticoccus sp. MNP-M23 TaxID=3072793 RepID=UPI002814BADD|nr:NADH-quinone oxidoreductase subunit NuoG [Acuticoccus sp. MNP-M23]WMS42341.1 NADH-quinone oxidoreductase subunit NuoG [Acuticoccus sp. MNP-M23]